jgi:hypothetical protein
MLVPEEASWQPESKARNAATWGPSWETHSEMNNGMTAGIPPIPSPDSAVWPLPKVWLG